MFSGWTPELQKQVNEKSADINNQWYGINTDGFKEWIAQTLPW